MHSAIGRTHTHAEAEDILSALVWSRLRQGSWLTGQGEDHWLGRSTWFWTAEDEDRKTDRMLAARHTPRTRDSINKQLWLLWRFGFQTNPIPPFSWHAPRLVSFKLFWTPHVLRHMTWSFYCGWDGDWPLKNVPFLIIKTSRVDSTRNDCQFCSIWLNMGRKNRSIDFSFYTPAINLYVCIIYISMLLRHWQAVWCHNMDCYEHTLHQTFSPTFWM